MYNSMKNIQSVSPSGDPGWFARAANLAAGVQEDGITAMDSSADALKANSDFLSNVNLALGIGVGAGVIGMVAGFMSVKRKGR